MVIVNKTSLMEHQCKEQGTEEGYLGQAEDEKGPLIVDNCLLK